MNHLCVMLISAALLPMMCGGSPAASDVRYLSDMQENIVHASQSWGALGVNTAAYAPGTQPMPLRIGEKTYAKGLGSHARGEIVVDLAGMYEKFEAEVGVQPQPGGGGSVVLRAFVDDKEVFDSGVLRAGDAAKPVSVSARGAEELRLVVEDAGDGIECDLGNWADARLTPDPDAVARPRERGVDVGLSADVYTWDAYRTQGAPNSRFQEFPADELFPGTRLLAAKDGSYKVPTAGDGVGCIGLQWIERRVVRELELQFADKSSVPSADGVQVQYWVMSASGGSPGGSRWQGHWEPLNGRLEQDGDKWLYKVDWIGNLNRRTGTMKIRWILPASPVKPIMVMRPEAFTDSGWETATLYLQADGGKKGTASIELYNGDLVQPKDSPTKLTWDMSKPLTLNLRYSKNKYWLGDRTVARIRVPGGGFGVAVDDIIANGCVYVPDYGFFVSSSQQLSLESYKKQIADKKTVLERVREMPDQTFEQAMEHVHRSQSDDGPAVISLANNNHKYIVLKNGSIEFADDPAVFNCIEHQTIVSYPCQIRPVFGSDARKVVDRHLENEWMPIPVITTRDGDVICRERVFVAPCDREPAAADAPIWLNRKPLCVAEFNIENPSEESRDVSLRIGVLADAVKGEQAAVKGGTGLFTVEKNGKLIAAINAGDASPLGAEVRGGEWVLSGKLPGKSQAKCAVLIPGWDTNADELAGLTDTEELLALTQSYWRRVMEPAIQVDVPDKLLKNLIIASQVHCLLAGRNEDEKNIAPWIGATYYGPLESEAQSVIRGMEFMGQTDFARRGLDYFIKRYNDQGFLCTGYTVMGTGWQLWTAAEYYQLTQDKAWLRANAPEFARVARWVMAQREKTKKLDAEGKRVPEWGLMPPGAMADWEVYAYYAYLNGYFYAGLDGIGRALKDIGYPEADEMVASAKELKGEMIRAFHWTQSLAPVYPLRDGTWVPAYPTHVYCPAPVNQFYAGEDAGRSWCYDVELGAHHLIPQGVMDAGSRDAKWMMEHMEDVQFLQGGWLEYPKEEVQADWYNLGGFAKVQPYYARTAEVYALQDDVKAFVRTYFNTIPSLLNREDLSLWEHFHAGAYNKTHETGYFLHQTRTMLLTERGRDLWIAPFVTCNWFADAMQIGVSNAPSRFGTVKYQITSHVDKGYIEAVIEQPGRELPDHYVVRLRHPQGKPIREVTVNGKKHLGFDAAEETVTVKAVPGRVTVRARY